MYNYISNHDTEFVVPWVMTTMNLEKASTTTRQWLLELLLGLSGLLWSL